MGAAMIDDSPQAVRSPPQPCRGADLRDPVAEVGLGSVSGAGEGSGVVVAGLARRTGGLVGGGVVEVDLAAQSGDPVGVGGGLRGAAEPDPVPDGLGVLVGIDGVLLGEVDHGVD